MNNQPENQSETQPAGQNQPSENNNQPGQSSSQGHVQNTPSPANEDNGSQQQPGTPGQKDGADKPAETETGTENPNVDPQKKPDTKY